VKPAVNVDQPFFTSEQISITVNGQTVQIFEYASAQEASDDAALVAPNGGSIGTIMISWIAPPHFYQAGNLIVLYVGNDSGVTDVLERVVGAPFVSGGASMLPLPVDNTESTDEFDRLLTASDVAEIAGSAVSLQEKRDYKAMAGGEQVASMDSWFGSTYQTRRGVGLTYSVIDFISAEAARAHYDSMLAEAAGLVPMSDTIGEASAELEVNSGGIGGMSIFVSADALVSFHTAQPDGTSPMVTIEGLRELAGLVAGRL
jgi:hypothetical protein